MAFTTEEYLILENIVHLSDMTGAKPGQTIGSLLEEVIESDNYKGGLMTKDEWKEMIGEITTNPEYQDILDLKVAATHTDSAPGGGDGTMAVFTSDSGEAVVAFAGSAKGEWADNFEGGGFTHGSDGVSTIQQEHALQWYKEMYEELNLEDYDITAIGHSKGGNKAKYLTLMDETIDHCVSFDGQGFSDEFCDEYADKIAARQYKIENHNLDNDAVNLLLNDVGQTTYYQHDPSDSNYGDAHNPYALFKQDGSLQLANTCDQDPNLKALDRFLNNMLRSMSPTEKAEMLAFVGTMVQDAKYGQFSMSELIDAADSRDKVAFLIAYMVNYSQKNPEMYGLVTEALENFGLGGCSQYVSVVSGILSNPLSNKLLDLLSKGVYGLEALASLWIVKQLYNLLNPGMSYDDFVHLISVIAKTLDYMDEIEVSEDSGNDLKVGSAAMNKFLFHLPAVFYVKTQSLRDTSTTLASCAESVKNTKQGLMDVRQNLEAYQVISKWRINNVINSLDTYERYLNKLSSCTNDIAGLYEGYEQKVIDAVPAV